LILQTTGRGNLFVESLLNSSAITSKIVLEICTKESTIRMGQSADLYLKSIPRKAPYEPGMIDENLVVEE
jgi:hypothetical protein